MNIASPGPREGASHGVLASLSLSMLLSSLGTSIANVGLPAIAQSYGATFQQVQWVVLAYLLAITTLIVTAGRLGDMMGRRRLLLVGIALFTAASILCGLAPSIWLLIAARAVQGMGAAMMMALTMALVGEAVPKEKTGSAMGLLGTMSAIGTALGPSLGGALIAGLGWRAIFLVNLPLGIVAFLVARRYLPQGSHQMNASRAGFDVPGTLVLAMTLAAYALAMTLGRGNWGALNLALLVAAAVGIGAFIRVEVRTRSPLIRLAVLREPAIGASLAMSALVSTVMMATLVVGPFYLSRGLGLDALLVGLVMSVGPLVAAVLAIPSGRLADRYGAQRMTTLGLTGILAGCLGLSAIASTLGIAGYVLSMMVLTAGYSLFQTTNNTAVMLGISQDQRGVVSGVLNLSRNLGLITGASVMGTIFARVAMTTDAAATSSHTVTAGMQVTFGVAAVLTVLAVVVLGSEYFRK